ncbi:unnamed protein product [Arctia plantaginis]|uniref:Elongation of very long chain fatty acids protein n=1 Tax=Arctia plantaginis TaxID=874455 RepID=A0A8S0YLX4_ARCPL|nr:unnamed protein product [Arctia plantaginis]
MATLDNNSFWDFKGIEEYNDGKLLIRTPYPVAFILISYLWFVLKIGPNYMKNRPPFNLRNLLVAYNAFQVVITFITFTMGIRALWNVGLWHTKCYVDEDLEKRLLLVDGSHYYFLTKIIELIDTVFFVLRKKQRQVTFLHVYHHTIMVVATWLITKYSRTDATIFLGAILSHVHPRRGEPLHLRVPSSLLPRVFRLLQYNPLHLSLWGLLRQVLYEEAQSQRHCERWKDD